MSLSPLVALGLSLGLVGAGGWFLGEGARGGHRVSAVMHGVMCWAMVPMLWSWGPRVPRAPQVVVLVAGGLWFVLQAARERRTLPAVVELHHAVMAALMVWMVVMPMPTPPKTPSMPDMPGMAQMQGTGQAPVPVLVIAGYCFLSGILWLVGVVRSDPDTGVRRLVTGFGHAVMSAGMGIATLAMA